MMRYGKVKKMPSERLSDGIGAVRERRNIEAPAFQIGRRAKPPALAHRSGLLASAPDPVFRFAMRGDPPQEAAHYSGFWKKLNRFSAIIPDRNARFGDIVNNIPVRHFVYMGIFPIPTLKNIKN